MRRYDILQNLIDVCRDQPVFDPAFKAMQSGNFKKVEELLKIHKGDVKRQLKDSGADPKTVDILDKFFIHVEKTMKLTQDLHEKAIFKRGALPPQDLEMLKKFETLLVGLPGHVPIGEKSKKAISDVANAQKELLLALNGVFFKLPKYHGAKRAWYMWKYSRMMRKETLPALEKAYGELTELSPAFEMGVGFTNWVGLIEYFLKDFVFKSKIRGNTITIMPKFLAHWIIKRSGKRKEKKKLETRGGVSFGTNIVFYLASYLLFAFFMTGFLLAVVCIAAPGKVGVSGLHSSVMGLISIFFAMFFAHVNMETTKHL